VPKYVTLKPCNILKNVVVSPQFLWCLHQNSVFHVQNTHTHTHTHTNTQTRTHIHKQESKCGSLQNSQSLKQTYQKSTEYYLILSRSVEIYYDRENFRIHADLNSAFHCKGKGKGAFNARTGHQRPWGE